MTPPASDEACLDVPIPRCEKRTAERAMRQELRRHLDDDQREFMRFLDDAHPVVTYPDPRDPRNTGPGFPAEKQQLFLERHLPNTDKKSKQKAALFYLLPGDDGEPRSEGRKRIELMTLENLAPAPYLQLFEYKFQASLRVDVDDVAVLDDLKDMGCPPNLIGFNAGADPSHRGRFQAWWFFRWPVSLENPKSAYKLDLLKRYIVSALGADKSGTRDVVRNPVCADDSEYVWHWLHDRLWTMDEIMAACGRASDLVQQWIEGDVQVGVVPSSLRRRRGDGTAVAGEYLGPRVLSRSQRKRMDCGNPIMEDPYYRPWRVREGTEYLYRNCSLFMMVSEKARQRRRAGHPIVEHDWVMGHLLELNELIIEDWGTKGFEPLPDSSLRSIARSVSRYWTEQYDPTFDSEARQKGTATLKAQGDETRRRVQELYDQGKSSRDIADELQISRQHVNRIKRELRELTQEKTPLEDSPEEPGSDRSKTRPLNRDVPPRDPDETLQDWAVQGEESPSEDPSSTRSLNRDVPPRDLIALRSEGSLSVDLSASRESLDTTLDQIVADAQRGPGASPEASRARSRPRPILRT